MNQQQPTHFFLKNLFLVIIGFCVAFVTPMQAYAQTSLGDYIVDAIGFGLVVVAVLTAVAVVAFIWGLIKLLFLAQSQNEVREGKQAVIWGIIGIFLLVSIWGVALIIRSDVFGVDPGDGFGSYFGRIIPLLPEGSSNNQQGEVDLNQILE